MNDRKNKKAIPPIIIPIMAAMALWAPTANGVETLLTIEPTKAFPRNSEGDVIELKDGRLCLVYSRFSGGGSDHAAADLAMRTSADGGKTWSEDRVVVAMEGGRNVMSVSLLRLDNAALAMFYLRKTSEQDCRPMMRVSTDEGSSWSDATECITDEVGYYVLNNDRAVQLSSKRLVLPVAMHHRPEQKEPDWKGQVMCYLSDDRGKNWRRSKDVLQGQSPNGERETVQEPGVVELEDGRLMMFCRTDGGSQYVSHSKDGGETWSALAPSALASPRSPATIERIPWNGKLLCVWNDHSGAHPFPAGKRTPLCWAISGDEGKSWSASRVIEADPDGWYCYTAMSFQKDRVMLAYCAGDKQVGGLNRLKVLAISRDDLEQAGSPNEPPKPEMALLESAMDYGRSFINTKAVFNSPRFWVESRCVITDPKAEKTVEFWQCGSCKSENTFAEKDLFQLNNYDFLPVFSAERGVIFRHRLEWAEGYRDVRPVEEWWGGIVPRLRKVKARVLRTPDEIHEAMDKGWPLIGQTELRDEASGRTAVLEYPIKTINWHRDRKIWQVDTGPVVLPDLSVGPGQWAETIQLAFIAFREFDWADFVVKQPTTIADGGKPVAKVLHYSEIIHHQSRNALLAIEAD
jgi:hypothetical protein